MNIKFALGLLLVIQYIPNSHAIAYGTASEWTNLKSTPGIVPCPPSHGTWTHCYAGNEFEGNNIKDLIKSLVVKDNNTFEVSLW